MLFWLKDVFFFDSTVVIPEGVGVFYFGCFVTSE